MLGGITANRTHLRGIGRVYKNNRHAGERSFVQYLPSQIVERPTMQLGTLIASSPYPIADALKVFKSNTASGAFRNVHKLLANLVIHILCESLFFTGKFFETTFGGLRAFLLQAFSLSASSFSNRIDLVPGELFAVRGGSNVGNTQIHAHKFFHVVRFGFINVTGGKEIKLIVNQNKVTFAPLGVEQFKLSFPGKKGDGLATFDCPDTYGLFVNLPGEDAVIVGEAAGGSKGAFGLTVEFVGIGDFGDGTHNHLSGKGELFPHRPVNQTVNGKLFKYSIVPSDLADIVARSISGLQGFKQCSVLLFSWLKFDFSRKFHNMIIHERSNQCKQMFFSCPVGQAAIPHHP